MITSIGVLGLTLYLLQLFLLETSRVKAKSKEYLLISLFGSSLLSFYAWQTEAYVFMVLNGVFVLLSLYWLFRLHR